AEFLDGGGFFLEGVDHAADLVDDGLGRTRRRHDDEPGGQEITRYGFAYRPHTWQHFQFVIASYAQGHQFAGSDVRQGGGHVVACQFDVACDQVGRRLRRALVRHVRDVYARQLLEQFQLDMAGAAYARRAPVQ